MPRKMYDAVTPTNILNHDKKPEIVAGYDDGSYKWTQASWNLFPDAVHVHINTQARYLTGTVLDVEPGDATPAQSVDWVQARRGAGVDPTIYCNRSMLVQVKAEFTRRGVWLPHFWIATGSGKFELYPGSVASQYLLDWQGVDVSCVADDWPGTAPAAQHANAASTPTIPLEDDIMLVPASPDDYVSVPCNGHTTLFISSAFGRKVTVLGIAGVKDNNGKNTPTYTAIQPGLKDINPDQPGPITVGPGCRAVQLRYSADHSFTAWCA